MRATPLWIIVGKMNPDVALTQRTEDRIRDRVRECIRIRVSFSATVGNNPHPAKYEIAAFHKPVRISPYSNP